MNNNQLLGIIGSLALLFGVFSPLFSAPIVGSGGNFLDVKIVGPIVLALAAISFVLTIMKKYKGLWLTGLGSAAIILYKFIDIQYKMYSMELGISLSWGWPMLGVAVGLLIWCAAIEQKHQDELVANTENENSMPKHCSKCDSVLETGVRFCSRCGYDVASSQNKPQRQLADIFPKILLDSSASSNMYLWLVMCYSFYYLLISYAFEILLFIRYNLGFELFEINVKKISNSLNIVSCLALAFFVILFTIMIRSEKIKIKQIPAHYIYLGILMCNHVFNCIHIFYNNYSIYIYCIEKITMVIVFIAIFIFHSTEGKFKTQFKQIPISHYYLTFLLYMFLSNSIINFSHIILSNKATNLILVYETFKTINKANGIILIILLSIIIIMHIFSKYASKKREARAS
jgi:hypothetical protein